MANNERMGEDRGIGGFTMPSNVNEEDAYEFACRIWFQAPGRAAQELSQLTKLERERVWADLTGSKEISNFELPVEEPAAIQECLNGFRDELMQYQAKNDPSRPLAIVLRRKPEYIYNPSFMIRFLRASNYLPKSARALLCRHFEMKQELFGSDRLDRDILLSDLSEGDMEFLTHGTYQYLKEPDRAGRLVSFLQYADPTFNCRERRSNVLRAIFYLNSTIAELESAQRLGIVRIGYFHHRYPLGGPDNDLIRMTLQIIDAVPIRCVAFYLVVSGSSSIWSQTLDLLVLLCQPWLRVRTRIVSGSFYENLYTLLCLGIPQSCIPTREDGAILNENLLSWLQERRTIETRSSNLTSGV